MQFGVRFGGFRVCVWLEFRIWNKLNLVKEEISMEMGNEILIKEFECLIYVLWVWWRLMNVDEGEVEDDEEEKVRQGF